MTSALVARQAIKAVARSCRADPPGVKAVLPFDPDDPEDVAFWMEGTKAAAENPARFEGTDGYVLQSWRWQAQDELKKARRRMPRDQRGRLRPIDDLQALQEDEQPPSHGLPGWTLTELAEVAAVAAQRYAAGHDGHGHRGALAALTCVGRLVGHVHHNLGPEVVSRFVEVLVSEPAFRRLGLRDQERAEFLSNLGQLGNTGNLRDDLRTSGLHWPGTVQWSGYVSVLRTLWSGSEGPPIGLEMEVAA